MKILFVCKHNKFRSKVAEAIFKKLNKDKKIKADSRGIIIYKPNPYVASNVIKFMKKKGYSVGGKSRRIINREIKNYDLLIIVADNVEKEFFISLGFKGKIIKWSIEDCSETDYECINITIDEIEKRVKGLIKGLNNKSI